MGLRQPAAAPGHRPGDQRRGRGRVRPARRPLDGARRRPADLGRRALRSPRGHRPGSGARHGLAPAQPSRRRDVARRGRAAHAAAHTRPAAPPPTASTSSPAASTRSACGPETPGPRSGAGRLERHVSAAMPGASGAPMRWKISRACPRRARAPATFPAARALRPRPARAWASSQELSILRARSSACWCRASAAPGSPPIRSRVPSSLSAFALAHLITKIAIDAERLLLGPGRFRVVPGQPVHDAQVTDRVRPGPAGDRVRCRCPAPPAGPWPRPGSPRPAARRLPGS